MTATVKSADRERKVSIDCRTARYEVLRAHVLSVKVKRHSSLGVDYIIFRPLVGMELAAMRNEVALVVVIFIATRIYAKRIVAIGTQLHTPRNIGIGFFTRKYVGPVPIKSGRHHPPGHGKRRSQRVEHVYRSDAHHVARAAGRVRPAAAVADNAGGHKRISVCRTVDSVCCGVKNSLCAAFGLAEVPDARVLAPHGLRGVRIRRRLSVLDVPVHRERHARRRKLRELDPED